MIPDKELISRVKDFFGLNIYETKAWIALLIKGIASAGEVAAVSGIPRSRTYDILESLEKKGFALSRLGKPAKYIGIKPKMILEQLKKNIEKDAGDRISNLLKVKETDEFSKLEELYIKGTDSVKVESASTALKGKFNISNHLKEIFKNAKEEIIICTNAEDMESKLKIFKQTFDDFKKANLKINIALSGNLEIIKKIQNALGIKIKKININSKFFIVDKKDTLFYLSKNTDKEDTAIWINSEFFSKAFSSFFERALTNSRIKEQS